MEQFEAMYSNVEEEEEQKTDDPNYEEPPF